MFNKRNIVPAVIVIIMFVGGFYSYLSKGNVKITQFEGTKATAVSAVQAKPGSEPVKALLTLPNSA